MSESTKFSVTSYTAAGKAQQQVTLPADLFDGTVNMPVMHQVVKAYLANRRQGNAATKTRGFVVGGNQKPWKQKGTGRARAGSRRAPTFVGGGTVFGPSPRSYAEYVPRQVRALARKSALNARARENAIVVIEPLDFDSPKTNRMRDLLVSLGVDGSKVLLLTDGAKPNVYLSGRNIPWAHVLPYSDVSTYHILWSDVVVIESSAFGAELDRSEDQTAQARRPAKKPAAKAKSADAAPRKAAKKKAAPARKSAEKSSGGKAAKAARSPAKRATPSAAGGKTAKKTAPKKTAPKKSAAKKSAPKKKKRR
ncbi:MAG: 50S ribosomal protein L4 [Gemmatimonadaceae bacterium]